MSHPLFHFNIGGVNLDHIGNWQWWTGVLIAVIIGFIGMFSGLILSYIADTPASASITLLFVALFLLVNLGSRLRK